MTAGWCSRTVRAAVFAAVCVVLAALGHVMMSGSHVPAWALSAGTAATGLAGWCLAGRERGLPLIVTVVVAAQTALHEAFSLAQSATGTPGSTTAMDMSGMGSMDMSAMDGAPTHATSHTAAVGSPSLGMLAAHLVAALLCGLWLAYGERAAFRVLRAVAGRLAAPLRLLLALPVTPERLLPHPRRGRSDRAPRLLLLVHAITSRGPPAVTAVV